MECHWRIAFENSENGTGFIFFWLNSQYSLGIILPPRSSHFTLHTHITPCPLSLHSSLLPPSSSPLCVLSNEISARRSRMIRSPHIGLEWLQRVAGKDAASLQCFIPVTTEIQQPDWIPSLTTHTLTHSHSHTHTRSHLNTFSRRNARACSGVNVIP